MTIKKIIILSTLFVQILSAPNGCLNACGTYRSHNTYETSSGYNEQGGLTKTTANLEDLSQISTAGLDSGFTNLDYTRPGNWTEQNQYGTDEGRGKVYEEHGQYVKGPKRVRFFRKNYTSSYNSGNMGGLESANRENLNTYSNYDSMQNRGIDHSSLRSGERLNGLENVSHRNTYNVLYGQQAQQSGRRAGSQSEKLEDFGEYGNTQVAQHGISGFNSQTAQDFEEPSVSKPGNWSNVDTYRTDGGHGKVFEEQGQYVTGPKRVRYYKKNYTSSYSTGDIPTLNTGSVRMQDFEKEIQQLHKQFDSFGREIHQSSSSHVASSNSGRLNTADLTQGTIDSGFANGDLQTTETGYQQGTNSRRTSAIDYTDRNVGHGMTSNSGTTGITGGNQQISQNTYTQSTFIPESTVTNQYEYRRKPSTNTYGTQNQQNSQNSYGSEDYLISQSMNRSPNPTGTQAATHGKTGQSHYEQLSNTERSGYTQSHVSNGNMEQGRYDQNVGVGGIVTGTRPGQVRHYEQYWSSSVHKQGELNPDSGIGSVQTNDNQQIQRVNQQQSEKIENLNQQSSYDIMHGHNTNVGQTNENNYNYAFRTRPGKLITSTLDVNQGTLGADCTEGSSGQIQYGSQYHRKYKRDSKYHEINDMLQQHQQTSKVEDFAQQDEDQFENKDLTQQNQYITQQTGGSDDFTQQTSGQLELGQNTQQSWNPDKVNINDQQSNDFTQQTSGQLELGQNTQQSWNPDTVNINDQQSSDLTQQTSGQLELGQNTQQSWNPDKVNINDQQSSDFTQQTSGQLELGQNTQQSWNPDKVNINDQQSSDFTQQTSGQLELGQNTQQSWNPDKVNINDQQSSDFTQQTSGQLELGIQTQEPWKFDTINIDNQHTQDLTQQSEDLTQQTGGFDDFTQQQSGKLELGQQVQESYRPGKLEIDDQHTDLIQQTSEPLEHQQVQSQWKFENPGTDNQYTQDLTQQNWKPKKLIPRQTEDLTQQTVDRIEQVLRHDEFSQQNQYPTQLEIEQLSQRNEDLTQQTDTFNHFNRAPENHGFDQQTNQFRQHGQTQSEQLEYMHHQRPNRFMPQPAAKPIPKPRYPKSEQLNYEQQKNLQLQTVADRQKPIPLNYAQQSNVEWQTADKMQQNIKESVHEKDDMNIDAIATPIEVNPEADIDDNAEGNIFRGDQAQGKPNDSKNISNEDYRQNVNDNFMQQGTTTVDQQNKFDIESQNLQQSNILQKPSNSRQPFSPRTSGQSQPHQLSSQWHYTHQAGDLTNSEGPQIDNFHGSINEQPHYFEQQSNVRPREQTGWQGQNNEGEDDIQQETQYINFGQQPQNLQQFSKVKLEKPIENPVPMVQTQFKTDKNNEQHSSQDRTVQQSHLEIEQQSQNQEDNPFLQQTDKINFGQQSENLQLTQQTQFDEGKYDHQQQSGRQQYGYGSRSEENTFDTESNLRQQIGNLEFGEQSPQFGQISDDFQQQSGKIEFGQETEDQTSDLRQQSMHGEVSEIDFQPRILQAYGANGPYEAIHNEDIFNNVKPNPSATLSPNINSADPWDIHEKSEEIPIELTTTTTTTEPTTEITNVVTEPPPPSFWGKLGNKFITTFDKAKEKARSLFG